MSKTLHVGITFRYFPFQFEMSMSTAIWLETIWILDSVYRPFLCSIYCIIMRHCSYFLLLFAFLCQRVLPEPLRFHHIWPFEGQWAIYKVMHLTLILVVANLANTKWRKPWKMTETLARWYSSQSTQRELPNEYQNDMV